MFRKNIDTNRLFKAALYAALIFFLLSANSFSFAAVFKDLTITADTMSYSEDGSSLEAFGSVEAVSKDIKVTAEHIIYNTRSVSIIADKGFKLELPKGLHISGEYLDYNVKTKNGITKNVVINYRNSVITGGFASISEEKIELRDASFNTCGLPSPHYHVSSLTTTLYPEDGWILGYFGYLWLGAVPSVPVPVYLYDLSVYGVGRRKTEAREVMPVPEMGSNDEDGFYIIYKIPWIANRKLTGRYVFMHTAKRGLGGGIESNYEMNDFNDIYSRIYYDPKYNYYGGITHTLHFGPEMNIDQESFYTFFKIRRQLMFDLITNLSYRERINYELVTAMPDVTLRMIDVPALFNNFKVGGEITYGHITEESSGSGYDRGIFKTNGMFDFPLGVWRLQLGAATNQTWYGSDMRWTRVNDIKRLSRNFDYGFDSYISHMHYILFEGHSPFRYESYWTIPSDEFGIGLGYNFDINRLTVDYTYYVPDNMPKDLDYGISLGFHCYNVDLKYRATRKEFLFGVSLITR